MLDFRIIYYCPGCEQKPKARKCSIYERLCWKCGKKECKKLGKHHWGQGYSIAGDSWHSSCDRCGHTETNYVGHQ